MKILSKLTVQSRVGDGRPFLHFRNDTIYFTLSAAATCNLIQDARICFIQDENYWGFYFHNDTNGWSIHQYQSGYRVHSLALIRMLKKSIRVESVAFSLYIEATDNEIDGHKIYKLLTNKLVQ